MRWLLCKVLEAELTRDEPGPVDRERFIGSIYQNNFKLIPDPTSAPWILLAPGFVHNYFPRNEIYFVFFFV